MANPTLLTSPIAENGDKNVIPASTGATTGLLDQEHGFQQINELPLQAGGLPPQRKDFNGALNLLSKILFYAQKGYVFEFDETQDYYAGCIVKDTDGNMYECIADVSASSTHPQNDTTNWQIASPLTVRGGLLVGDIIGRAVNDGLLQICGGTDQNHGCAINLMGKDKIVDGQQGYIEILTGDYTDYSQFQFLPNGLIYITTNGGNYNRVSGGGVVGSTIANTGYVKTKEGVLMQWGGIGAGTTWTVNFPISFNNANAYTPAIHTIWGPNASYTISNYGPNTMSGTCSQANAGGRWLAIGY